MWPRAEATIPALSFTAITGTNTPYVQDRSSPEKNVHAGPRQVGRVSSDSALKAAPSQLKLSRTVANENGLPRTVSSGVGNNSPNMKKILRWPTPNSPPRMTYVFLTLREADG